MYGMQKQKEKKRVRVQSENPFVSPWRYKGPERSVDAAEHVRILTSKVEKTQDT